MVLATVVTSDAQFNTVHEHFTKLREDVAKLGVDVHSHDFEFHAYDLFGRKDPWRHLDESTRREIALSILEAGVQSRAPYAVLVIDMRGGGSRGIEKLQHVIDGELTRASAELPIARWSQDLQAGVATKYQRRDLGPLVNLTAMLFGLTTSLIDELGLTGKGNVKADKQFFKLVGGWQALFRVLSEDWGTLIDRTFTADMPADYHPQWHLGDEPEEVESWDSYGVQLADYIAYTTRRLWLNPLDVENRRVAITKYDEIPPLPGYPGFFGAIPEWATDRPSRDSSQTHWRRRHMGIR